MRSRGWNRKYWDILDQLYWSPKYVGLTSVRQSLLERSADRVSIPGEILPAGGAIYVRRRKAAAHQDWLRGQEEILNHVFDLTYGIAPDSLIETCFLSPLGLADGGPFSSVGREVRSRYGWTESDNVTQQDGLFVGVGCAVGVELKLGASSSPSQIIKYASLMAWEEILAGRQLDPGLLFVLPTEDHSRHWKTCKLDGPCVDRRLLAEVAPEQFPKRIREFLLQNGQHVESVLDRLQLGAISWSGLRATLVVYASTLDPARPGDQTLQRLIEGLVCQIEEHQGTGLLDRPLSVEGDRGEGAVDFGLRPDDRG